MKLIGETGLTEALNNAAIYPYDPNATEWGVHWLITSGCVTTIASEIRFSIPTGRYWIKYPKKISLALSIRCGGTYVLCSTSSSASSVLGVNNSTGVLAGTGYASGGTSGTNIYVKVDTLAFPSLSSTSYLPNQTYDRSNIFISLGAYSDSACTTSTTFSATNNSVLSIELFDALVTFS